MKLTIHSGSFACGENEAVSKSSNNLATIEGKSFESGTFKARISANGSNDAGLIFAADSTAKNYYFVGMNSTSGSRLILVKHHNGADVELGGCYVTAGYNYSANIEIKVEYLNGDIKCFFDDKMFIYRVDEEPLAGTCIGLKSKNKGTEYTEISISNEQNFKEYETLIIGHSYMELWTNYREDLSRFADIFNIGIGGTATTDWIPHKSEVLKYNPKNLIYMIGINDYPRGTSAETIVNNIKQLIDPVIAELTETKVCLVSVNQCVTHTDYKQEILETNTLLKTYVNSNDRLLYANIDNAFLDDSGNPIDSCFVDGLHPTEASYKVIAQAIYDAFDHKEDIRSTLIIGHSYMDNWKGQCVSDLSNYENVTNIGVGMTNSLYWTNKISEIASYKPSKLIYMTGINDIPHGVENRTLYTHLKKVLVEIHDTIEDVEVCLLSIPQVPMFYDEYREKINEANNYYKKLAVDLDYVQYGDLDEAYLNEDGTPNSDCFSDGLHPLMSEYGVIVDAINEAFEGINQPTEEDIYVEVDNVEYQEETATAFVNDLNVNNPSVNWLFDGNTIKTTGTGMALSNETYSNFDLVYNADILTSDNPYFSGDCKKGIIFGGEITENSFKGYFLSVGEEWLEVCYSDGTTAYKCAFIDGLNLCSAHANIRLSVTGQNCQITYGDGVSVGTYFSGATTSFRLYNYSGGSIGLICEEEITTTFEFKEVVARSSEDDDKSAFLLNDLSTTGNKNEGNDFVIDSSIKTITTSSNDGYLISNDNYTNFDIGVKLTSTNAVNPFFYHVAQEAILFGGAYVDGKYSGYAITFDKTTWIEVVYIDGNNNNACTFIDGWNIEFLNKDLVLSVSSSNVYLSMLDGTAIPNTFNGNSSISIDNYNGGKIGILSYDGEPSTYILNSFIYSN